MKKFSIPCDFNGQKIPVTVYIGHPADGKHALDHQARWLSDTKGGTIPQEVMLSLEKLQRLAEKNNVSFEELCEYALTAATIKGPDA